MTAAALLLVGVLVVADLVSLVGGAIGRGEVVKVGGDAGRVTSVRLALVLVDEDGGSGTGVGVGSVLEGLVDTTLFATYDPQFWTNQCSMKFSRSLECEVLLVQQRYAIRQHCHQDSGLEHIRVFEAGSIPSHIHIRAAEGQSRYR